ncbi:hypothetical protein HYT02_00225 [Candidatus Gottesmanbacteria bacterium]|nr:hypothetical protein [Candidatus Gottesmanbacteria bacterium]
MRKSFVSIPTIHTFSLAQKGQEIYNKNKDKFEKENYGKFVAIEVDSEKYFIDDKLDKVLQQAQKKFPKKVFYTLRIGYPGAISISTFHRPITYGSFF